MKKKDLKKLIQKSHIEFSIDGTFAKNKIDNDRDQLKIQQFIQILSEMICSDTVIRRANHMGYMYDVHEIPYYGENWFISLDPRGTTIALGLDECDVINQSENYVMFQDFSNDTKKEWDTDVFCPVQTYTLN